jgi:hypothetical protein
MLQDRWLQFESHYVRYIHDDPASSQMSNREGEVGEVKQQTCPYSRLEVFTAVTMKNGVFWDITPCGS